MWVGHLFCMGVAAHLGIDLAEYDERIRTFIPYYEEMLDVAAEAVPVSVKTIVDLGTGTGALAAKCVEKASRAHVFGIDADAGILAAAAGRLHRRGSFLCANFAKVPLPDCDIVVASFALHHIRTRTAKAALYGKIRKALRRSGIVVSVDCHPAADPELAQEQHQAWRSHLEKWYSKKQAASLLKAWSREDVYVPLADEVSLMKDGGFAVEVLWRKGAFAVLVGKK